MAETKPYVIRGGVAGRERLRILARVMRETSSTLLDRLELRDGLACLDVGCGGGDMSLVLAERVAPGGRVVGVDMDAVELDLARAEARERGAANVEFRVAAVQEISGASDFDVVYARF